MRLRPFLEQDHLVHIGAGEAVGSGDEHAVNLAALHAIAQAVQTRTGKDRAAGAVVAEHVGWVEDPALGGMGVDMGGEPSELLLNGLVIDLVAGRDAAVNRYLHRRPPAGLGTPVPGLVPERSSPTAEGADTPGPSAAGRGRRRAGAPNLPGASPLTSRAGRLGE
jgi:hypothetical protein